MAFKVSFLILIACVSVCYSSETVQRGNIECTTVVCPLNHIFKSCSQNRERDICIPCPQEYFMPDRIKTADWTDLTALPDCIWANCNECDSSEAVLDNPDTCGITETARCVCDRAKLFYGINKAGVITSCTRKTGDICDRPGEQLTQEGECEDCPAGTEKTTADTSLCKKKEETSTPTPTPIITRPPSTTLSPSGMEGGKSESPDTDPVAIGAGIGVPVGVAFIVIVIVLCVCWKRKQRGVDNRNESKGENCCSGVSSDGSSRSSACEPLMNGKPAMDSFTNNSHVVTEKPSMVTFNNNSSLVKPMMKVAPTISIDESEEKEDDGFGSNIDDEIIHDGGSNRLNGSAGRTVPVPPMQPDMSITEVKYPHSADETDLKLPAASQNGRGQSDWQNTELKTVCSESEETAAKQVWSVSTDRGRHSERVATRPQEQTYPKQIVSVMPSRETTVVRPFGVSKDAGPKEIMRDLGERNSEECTVSVSVSPLRETSVKQCEGNDSKRADTVISVTPNLAIIPCAQDVDDKSPLERISEENSMSSHISNQSRCDNDNLSHQNSSQPPCHLTIESESSLPPKSIGGNSHLSQGRTVTETVDADRTSAPMSAPAAVVKQTHSGDSIAVSAQGNPAEEHQSHSSVLTEDRESGRQESTRSIEGAKKEDSPPHQTPGVVRPMVAVSADLQQRSKPETTRVQSSQPFIRGVVDGNAERRGPNSVMFIHRQVSLPNASGSIVQNSGEQNSTASSGYGTAIVGNKRETDSIQSLGLGGLMAVPSLNPNSFLSAPANVESQNEYVPGPIKRESRLAIPEAPEETGSSRNRPINQAPQQQQNVNMESGYCS